MRCFEPADPSRLNAEIWETKVMRMFMMLAEKYTAEGEFEKVKGRFNANPKTIRRPLKHTDNASPTATIEAINTLLHLYAQEGQVEQL